MIRTRNSDRNHKFDVFDAMQNGTSLKIPNASGFVIGTGREESLINADREAHAFLPDRQTLISGDAILTRDLYSGNHSGPQVARPRLNHDHHETLLSLDRFSELGEVTILPVTAGN